jgi:hypothetical protein
MIIENLDYLFLSSSIPWLFSIIICSCSNFCSIITSNVKQTCYEFRISYQLQSCHSSGNERKLYFKMDQKLTLSETYLPYPGLEESHPGACEVRVWLVVGT